MYTLRRTCKCYCVKSNIFIQHSHVKKCSNVPQNSSNSELDPGYVPHKVENSYFNDNYFQPPIDNTKKPFSLILPPPNITGNLHLGHALTGTVQDVLVRWKRMQGFETMWVPGIDHAGIATQVVVEKRLWQQRRKNRHDLGRKMFENEVWKWKEEKAVEIENQLRRLNFSLNWNQKVFTMDKTRSNAVQKAFITLFDTGLIYRADNLVNWCCNLRSAISDIEVDHLEVDGPTNLDVPGYERPVEFGTLVKFAYKLKDSDEEIVVATTRPETMFGDVAVAVNPKDERYRKYVGRHLWHPFRNTEIPVLSDDFVDPDFGTGAVKVTPAHNTTDFELGKRHNLDIVQVIDEKGLLTPSCGEFGGLRRFDARNVILDRLADMQLFRGKQRHQMIVPICSRSKDVVELLVRPQWFVNCRQMASEALKDVRDGRLAIEPKRFEKTWANWLENIRDWCVSRQLWWGHRIPAYSCTKHGVPEDVIWVAASDIGEAKLKAAGRFSCSEYEVDVKQDEDVFDTWFSSGLQPFSAFGWPVKTDELSKYYPLSLMETGHDILFFWVARMVMLGKQLTGTLPFDKILLHGIICDAHGRKMSKSLGNVIAPEDVIAGSTLQDLENITKASHSAGILSKDELARALQGQKRMFPNGIPECGSDALRFTMLSHNVKNEFINFDVNECYNNKLFCNKIWQATKFSTLWYDKVSQERNLTRLELDKLDLGLMDKWTLSRLTYMVETVNNTMENRDFHVATASLKNFLYYEFCDVYLESTKRGLKIPDSPNAAGHCLTLLTALDIGLRALAPFMPVLAQHLHSRLPLTKKNLTYPKNLNWRDEMLEKQVDAVTNVIVAIRRLKKIFNITAKYTPEAIIVTDSPIIPKYSPVIQDLCALHKIDISNELSRENQLRKTVKDTVGTVNIHMVVPEELVESLTVDMPKMEKKKEKVLKELEKIKKMVSGETYKINASVEAQETHSRKIASLEEKLSRINYIQSLSK